jgi:hypothetical protein
LQSFLSLVLAVAMASGIQGAPSSRDTFENVPQTLSGTNFFLFLSLFWCCNEMHPVSFIGLVYSMETSISTLPPVLACMVSGCPH